MLQRDVQAGLAVKRMKDDSVGKPRRFDLPRGFGGQRAFADAARAAERHYAPRLRVRQQLREFLRPVGEMRGAVWALKRDVARRRRIEGAAAIRAARFLNQRGAVRLIAGANQLFCCFQQRDERIAAVRKLAVIPQVSY